MRVGKIMPNNTNLKSDNIVHKQIEDTGHKPWGIFDDSSDLGRALAYVDGMLSDYSSLVAMFEVTGKPLLIQDVKNQISDNNQYHQYLFGADSESGSLLYITTYHNLVSSIYTLDTADLSRHHYCNYPLFESNIITLPYSYVVSKIGDKAYFAPRWWVNANHIAIYEESTKQFEFIPLDEHSIKLLDDKDKNTLKKRGSLYVYSESPKFQNIIRFKDSLFIIPSSYPGIVKLNLKTNKISHYSDFVEKVLLLTEHYGHKSSYAFGASVQIETKIYLCCRWADLIVEFDVEACESKVIKLSERGYGNQHVQFDGTNMWLFAVSGSDITRWNPITLETRVYNNYQGVAAKAPQWQSFAVFEGFIIASIANGEGEPLKINVSSGEISVATELLKLLSYDEHITSLVVCNEKLYVSTDKAQIFELSSLNAKARTGAISISKEEHQQFCKSLVEYYNDIGYSILTENAGLSLDEFIDATIAGVKPIEHSEHSQGEAGKKIYGYVKNLMMG